MSKVRVLFIRGMFLKNAKYLVIPLFNVEILGFWKGMDPGSSNVGRVSEHWTLLNWTIIPSVSYELIFI